MNLKPRTIPRLIYLAVTAMFLVSLLSGCSSIANLINAYQEPQSQLAEVQFIAHLNTPLAPGTSLVLEMLDDVTGLYFNSVRLDMNPDNDLTYSITVPAAVASEVKYRYLRIRDGSEYEYNPAHEQVRFRLLRVNGQQVVEDSIAGWMSEPYAGPVGRVSGQAIDVDSNTPIPNLLVTVGGQQTITASDGTFILNDLILGVQNLVIYSMDGAYETFQQGALIAENSNTPVQVFLKKRSVTTVTFNVRLPAGLSSLPLRFVSNLSSLGNAYADLSSGSAGSAVNYPELQKIAGNRYSIKLDLPVGFYLRYKYSLGDGFWNAELDADGKFVLRDRLVAENAVINDNVKTFTVNGYEPVHFEVEVPATTPNQEKIYLQLNAFGWMEPLPMVAAGNGKWSFDLYSPLHFLGKVEYRFCRSGDCTAGLEVSPQTRNFTPLNQPQTFSDSVSAWKGLSASTVDTAKLLETGSIQPKPGFYTGVELTPGFLPSWRATIDSGIQFAKNLGGDWMLLSPTWTAVQTNLPSIAPQPGRDLLWPDLITMNSHVIVNGQKTILFPQLNYTQTGELYWSGQKSDDWWLTWYDQYDRFIFQNADLAQVLGIEGLVIGDPSTFPAMNTDLEGQGISQAKHSTADKRWDALIGGVRDRYKGTLIGVMVIGPDGDLIPAWLDQVDMVYVLLSPTLANTEGDVADLSNQFDTIINERVQPKIQEINKPVIIGISYPSSSEAGSGFPLMSTYQQLSPAEVTGSDADLEIQARIYSAAILSSASKDWINGFISRGFYSSLELQDASSTIYRKPASDILWFWFHYLLNKAP